MSKGSLKLYVLSLITVVFSLNTFADQSYQLKRFEDRLKELEADLFEVTDPKIAMEKILKDPNSRINVFQLQALAKTYISLDKNFKKLVRDFKMLEDGIGQVDKWQSLGYKEKVAKAKQDFATKIEENNWVEAGENNKLFQIQSFLRNFHWSNEEKDVSFLANQLGKKLKDIDSVHYQFSTLEGNDSLHEFRREVRWFLLQSITTDGAISFKKDINDCPIEKYKSLLELPIAKSKYSRLRMPGKDQPTCQLPRCLYIALVKNVEDLGELKDKVEKLIGDNESNVVPPEIKVQAEKIYSEMKDDNLLSVLANEFTKCE